MSYNDDFTGFEQKMILLARTMRGAAGKDRSLFVLSATVRRLRRLLRAMEHELDWAVADFLDGWPGTEEGYNGLDRGMIFWRPTDSDRYEQSGELKMVDGYDSAQWVTENGEPLEIVPFAQRDIVSSEYTRALKHAKGVMEAGYKEADDASPAVVGYQATQVVTEDQLLTWYHRGVEHRNEIERRAQQQAHWEKVQADRARDRQPSPGWSLFDWRTGERVGTATIEQVRAFQSLEADEPVLVDVEDPTVTAHVGWRQGMARVKEGRKWVVKATGPHHYQGERPVRVGQNELTATSQEEA